MFPLRHQVTKTGREGSRQAFCAPFLKSPTWPRQTIRRLLASFSTFGRCTKPLEHLSVESYMQDLWDSFLVPPTKPMYTHSGLTYMCGLLPTSVPRIRRRRIRSCRGSGSGKPMLFRSGSPASPDRNLSKFAGLGTPSSDSRADRPCHAHDNNRYY